MSDYDDIINHPHFQSKTRPQMSMHDRAAQFSPFAALVGFDAAVEETGRLTDERIVLDEDALQELNAQIAGLTAGDEVSITYFIPDLFKDGGMYLPLQGTIRRIDFEQRIIHFSTGEEINFNDIYSVENV